MPKRRASQEQFPRKSLQVPFFLCRFLSWLLPSPVFRWKSVLGKESKRIHLQLSMDLLEGAAENLEVPNALNLESFMSQSTQKTYRLTFE